MRRAHELDLRADRRPLKLRGAGIWVPLALYFARRGVTPNAVSMIGLVAGVAAGGLLAFTSLVGDDVWQRCLWFGAALSIMLRGACNILDGVMTVETGRATPLGLLWNEAPDRVTDAATLVGAGYAFGAVPSLGWSAALVATLVSYVRVQCRLAGAPMDFRGPMAKPMRMITIVAAALWMTFTPLPWNANTAGRGAMTFALWIVIAGGAITLARRLHAAARALRAVPAVP